MATVETVEITEVGPRDGLQMADGLMPTEGKIAWIAAQARAGFKTIEVCSFVPPKVVPAMADAKEVTEAAARIEGLTVAALVPNLKGAERAVEAGAKVLGMPISASRLHSQSNLRMTPEEAVEQVRRVAALRDKLPADRAPVIEAGISTAFGCTMEGQVDEGWVVRLAAMLVTAGADSVSLADTVGHANPAQIKRVFTAVRGEIGDKLAAAHLHNTLGLGLANALAAYEVGVRSFDSSLGGLGGCPFAPGASGNVVTEDLVFMFEAMGVDTGIDIDAMLACREIVKAWLPSDPLFGHLADVGLPKGFLQQAQAAE